MKTRNGITLISDGPYARVNRKPTMASMKMIPYVKQKQTGKDNQHHDGGRKVYYFSRIITLPFRYVGHQFSDKGYITVNYHFLRIVCKNLYIGNRYFVFASFLFSEFRWIGDGPYASYPKIEIERFRILSSFCRRHLFSRQSQECRLCGIFRQERKRFYPFGKQSQFGCRKDTGRNIGSHNAYVSGRFNKGNAP